jgi:hypothetical protein
VSLAVIVFENLTHKFYAASISIDPTGALLVTSTRDRFMAWATLFCFLAALTLIIFLIWRKPMARRCSVAVFVLSLIIPLYVIPTARNEFIRVSEIEMTIDSSNWLIDSKQVIKLSDLELLKETQSGFIPGNLMGDPDVLWHFSWKDGKKQTIALNDFFNAHRYVVAHYIRERGNIIEWLDKPIDITFIE